MSRCGWTIAYALPVAVWLFFLFRYGDSVNLNAWPYYLLLCPLLLYIFFFFSYFERKRGAAKSASFPKKVYRCVCLSVLGIALLDSGGAGVNRWLHQRLVDGDERYDLVINDWINRRRLHLPPASGFTELGPFLPNTSGSIVDSPVTVDRFGFRRESPDSHPILSTSDTVNLLCLGGSVMFGMTTAPGDLPIPDMLQRKLDHMKLGSPIRVYNGAFPGLSVQHSLEGLLVSFHQLPPRAVIFMEGINWLAPGQLGFLERRNSLLFTWLRNHQQRRRSLEAVLRYEPIQYAETLRALARECRALDPPAEPVFVAFSLPFTEDDVPRSLAYWDLMQNGQGTAFAAAVLVRKHNDAMKRIAQEEYALFIDPRPLLQGKPKFFIDSCHLTQEGNRILARLLANAVERFVIP